MLSPTGNPSMDNLAAILQAVPLTYLKRLRVAMLKINQSFVHDMLEDPEDLAILQGVIGLAAAFKREVIAEGVETVEHGTALLHLGCQLAQGYGIARPMPAEQLPAWAATWLPDAAWCAVLNFGEASLSTKVQACAELTFADGGK